MKRKTSTLPTRIYNYSCLAPTAGAARVDFELRAARVYRNKLIEIERQRRECYRIIVADPAVQAIDAGIATLDAERKGLRLAVKAARAAKRGRVTADAAVTARVRQIGNEIKTARERRRAAVDIAKSDPRRAFFIGLVDACADRAAKEAYAAAACGWGTKLQVMKAHEAICKSPTDPQFRKWDGSGRLAVQIQKSKENGVAMLGMTVARLMSGLDNRARLVPLSVVPGRRPLHLLGLRLGDDDTGAPVWAEWPVILHRPLPADGAVKWVWVKRERLGAHWRWTLSVTVEAPAEARPRGEGAVAIDIGWRLRGGRALRVAYWYDDQGKHGEIVLPGGRTGVVEKLEHAVSLGVIQGRNFDKHRDLLASWIGAAASALPDWFKEQSTALPQWKSHRRLCDLVTAWRSQRFAGDETIFTAMEAWRKQHLHLNEWEVNERVKALARRRDFYRCIAADFGKRYRIVALEDFDLRKVQRKAAPETPEPDLPRPVRYMQRVAATSELRQCLIERLDPAWVEMAGTTITCADCGAIMARDEDALEITCPGCSRVWDQDENAARVIMQRHVASGSVPSATPDPLAPGIINLDAGLDSLHPDAEPAPPAVV